MPEHYYDYDNQAWITDSKYDDCQHPAEMDCKCYGHIHAGEPASPTARLDNDLEHAASLLNNAKDRLAELRKQIHARAKARKQIINDKSLTLAERFEKLLKSSEEF